MFVIGAGGREHALVWHLAQFCPGATLFCAPGNPGIAQIATCLPIPLTDHTALADAAASLRISQTIVGPEAPLVGGIVDHFESKHLPIIGPSRAAAALEGSKVFAKSLMQRHDIPTAAFAAFDSPDAALRFVDRAAGPLVVKADGLAAGKGVVVCREPDEARAAIQSMMVDRVFAEAGVRIVIEECLDGEEVSVFALVDGEAVALLPAAQDHKRVQDGDRGPNTGGMGAAAPYTLSDALRQRIRREILDRVAHAMCAEGRPYRGILFVGLMVTEAGPKVLEFNCRLGDPEAEVILPLLSIGLPDAFAALRAGRLDPVDLPSAGGSAVGVVLASRGYPESPQVGLPIEGLQAAQADALVFHSGTAVREGRVMTAGGRVLTIVGQDATITAARSRAYQAAARIHFDGMHFRRDIGTRLAGAVVPAGRE